ncbi:hypothetical protein BASA60_003262 [Batrachochytrium salamandrivorans]|nr:hypothetical protein BASA60_003262 [Batrachochytrium salamandrivorans]
MKLISFAALSLLAITVSAQSPQGSATQDIQRSNQDRMRDIISRVKEDYEAAENRVAKLGKDIKGTKASLTKFAQLIAMTKEKMPATDLSDKQRSTLKKYYDHFNVTFKELSLTRRRQLGSFEKARQERDEAKMLLDSFMNIQ